MHTERHPTTSTKHRTSNGSKMRTVIGAALTALMTGALIAFTGVAHATTDPVNPINNSTLIEGCPEITDAVDRLYDAYFDRPGDEAGLTYWTERWSTAGIDLVSMSRFFSSSAEFTERYGSLENREYVELVYRNVLHRNPDQNGLAYWTGRLDRGLDRGTLMLLFSESPEFATTSATIPSPFGPFNWLPEGSQFMCTKNGTLWGDLTTARLGDLQVLLTVETAPEYPTTVVHIGGAGHRRADDSALARLHLPATIAGRAEVTPADRTWTGWVRLRASLRNPTPTTRSLIASGPPGTRIVMIVLP